MSRISYGKEIKETIVIGCISFGTSQRRNRFCSDATPLLASQFLHTACWLLVHAGFLCCYDSRSKLILFRLWVLLWCFGGAWPWSWSWSFGHVLFCCRQSRDRGRDPWCKVWFVVGLVLVLVFVLTLTISVGVFWLGFVVLVLGLILVLVLGLVLRCLMMCFVLSCTLHVLTYGVCHVLSCALTMNYDTKKGKCPRPPNGRISACQRCFSQPIVVLHSPDLALLN
jgi:hypothetical protein